MAIRRGAKSPSCRRRRVGTHGVCKAPLLLESYCQATNGISLQRLIPTKLPIKVPFKVRNVTLVAIAWGGTHRTMAACVFYLGGLPPQGPMCVFPSPHKFPGYATD